eukprot:3774965-Amphidinium_carterae.2
MPTEIESSECDLSPAWSCTCAQALPRTYPLGQGVLPKIMAAARCSYNLTWSFNKAPRKWLDERPEAQNRPRQVWSCGCLSALSSMRHSTADCPAQAAHVGSKQGTCLSPWRGGMTDLDVDYAAEEAAPLEDHAETGEKTDDVPEEVQAPEDQATAAVLPTAEVAEQYDPERRAKVLAGRLHLGMELDDRRVLPPGEATKSFTIRWGEVVGGVRKATEALWQSIANFNAMQKLLWHGCWHLDFLSNDQADAEAYNLNKVLWQHGHDWTHAKETISRCRAKMRQLTNLLDPAWQDLKTQIAKNKPKQRTAWDSGLAN